MERENKRLQLEEQKREKIQIMRKKRAEAGNNAGDFINKLKEDLLKINE